MTNKVKFVLYGTHARDEFIDNMSVILQNEDFMVLYNEGHSGEVLDLCQNAWAVGFQSDTDYICVLQDDLQLCTNFVEILDEILTALNPYRDKYILSLFNFENMGTTYTVLSKNETPYIGISMISGCINIMTKQTAEKWLNWLETNSKTSLADDTALTDFAETEHLVIVSTKNSLVQHLGDVSLINTNRPIRKSNNFSDVAVGNWANVDWSAIEHRIRPSLKHKLLF